MTIHYIILLHTHTDANIIPHTYMDAKYNTIHTHTDARYIITHILYILNIPSQ